MPAEWRMKSSMRRKEFIDLILDSISDYFDIYHNYSFMRIVITDTINMRVQHRNPGYGR